MFWISLTEKAIEPDTKQLKSWNNKVLISHVTWRLCFDITFVLTVLCTVLHGETRKTYISESFSQHPEYKTVLKLCASVFKPGFPMLSTVLHWKKHLNNDSTYNPMYYWHFRENCGYFPKRKGYLSKSHAMVMYSKISQRRFFFTVMENTSLTGWLWSTLVEYC